MIPPAPRLRINSEDLLIENDGPLLPINNNNKFIPPIIPKIPIAIITHSSAENNEIILNALAANTDPDDISVL